MTSVCRPPDQNRDVLISVANFIMEQLNVARQHGQITLTASISASGFDCTAFLLAPPSGSESSGSDSFEHNGTDPLC